jgi:hypothetical protein
VDGHDHIAFVAIQVDGRGRELEPLGFARCQRLSPGGAVAELSMVTVDQVQGMGVGSALLSRLIVAAQRQGIDRFWFEVLMENNGMRRLAQKIHSKAHWADDGTLEYDCLLADALPKALPAPSLATPPAYHARPTRAQPRLALVPGPRLLDGALDRDLAVRPGRLSEPAGGRQRGCQPLAGVAKAPAPLWPGLAGRGLDRSDPPTPNGNAMNPELMVVLLLLAAAILMFALNRPRADAVALMMMLALPFTGILTISEAIAGFSNSNIVLIGAMFVVGEALARTGVAKGVGDWLADRGGSSAWLLTLLIMLAVGLLGSLMSSTGVVAIFIPVVLRIANRTGLDPAQLLMPMAYAALVSGMLTLVATSPNLIINYELVRSGVEGLNFFSFTPFGLPILVVTILYMLVARRWLRSTRSDESGGRPQPEMMDWIDRYDLANREYRVRVLPGSPWCGNRWARWIYLIKLG